MNESAVTATHDPHDVLFPWESSTPRVLVFVTRAPQRQLREGTTSGSQYDPEAVGARVRSGIEAAARTAVAVGDAATPSQSDLVRYCLDDMVAAARIRTLRDFK